MECAAGVINPCPTTLAGPASHLFLTLINTLMASQCALGPEGRYPPDYGQFLKDGDEFDFIVVGSGSAGSVVANRLSQVEDWKVLLLEAGDYPSAMSEIPSLLFSLQGTSEDWQYVMEPSKTCCLSLKDNACPCPRGKAIGGSSVLNSMLYIRGNRQDFDSWADAGNIGWDYDSVVKNYKNVENGQGQKRNHFGKDGELAISRYRNDQPIHQILVDAYRELGYNKYKEEKPLGYLDSYMSISQGTRSNTGKAFIERVKDRKNLYVAVNAQVGKLLIDAQTETVNGVEVKISNKILKIKAKKEVILSAGSINSPQILMNSGIGPKEHLESLGINVVKALNVGENLQDHLIFPVFLNIKKPVLKPKTPLDIIDEIYKYFMHREGPLSKIEITNFMGFVNTKNNSAFPNVQLQHIVHYQNDLYLLPEVERAFRLPEEVTTTLAEYNKDTNIMIIAPTLLKPKSAGRILLRSADPFEKPLIFPNYLSDSSNEDLQLVVEGVRFVEMLIRTKTFEEYQPELVDANLSNCKQFTFGTDDYWKCAIRNIAGNVFHQVGTCKMGPGEDSSAVVDPRLRVHGIKGVRVIDGSIMPMITSGNTNAPIIMIGEKGAELIKEDWLQKHDGVILNTTFFGYFSSWY